MNYSVYALESIRELIGSDVGNTDNLELFAKFSIYGLQFGNFGTTGSTMVTRQVYQHNCAVLGLKQLTL